VGLVFVSRRTLCRAVSIQDSLILFFLLLLPETAGMPPNLAMSLHQAKAPSMQFAALEVQLR
jgi:hypothetical protein